MQEVPTTLHQVTESISGTLLHVWGDFVAHVPFLVAGLVLLCATWAATALFQRVAPRFIRHGKLRASMQELIVRILSIAIWGLGLLLVAMVVFPGLTPARALGGLGLLSIAVGFAFKDIFENFFAGVLILWRFPFENGDFIECDGIVGRVEAVTVRMTMLRRPSGELVVLPNATVFKSAVDVLTDRPHRRISLLTGVAYGEDADASVEVIREAVESCKTVRKDPPVEIFANAFGASSIDIEVAWWTKPTPLEFRRSRSEVVLAIKRALDGAGIEIPFPYRTLTFKEPLGIGDASLPSEHAGDGSAR